MIKKITQKNKYKKGLARAVTFGFNQIVRIFVMSKDAILSLKRIMVNQLAFKTEQRQKSTAGFTLIELMVTLTIFVLVSGIVLFNQGKFNGSIVLTNLAYDTALSIRQAQVFGVSGKIEDIQKKPQYGVIFQTGDANSANTQFKLFSSLDKVYSASGNNNVLETSKISSGNYVAALCLVNTSNTCVPVDDMAIVFKRPEPEAYFYSSSITDNSAYSEARISLKSKSDDNSARQVIVTKIGLIYVER